MELDIIKNDRYEILTENGFRDFSGIKKTKAKTILLTFSDKSHLRCTYSHKIRLKSGVFVEAQDIKIGDFTSSGVYLSEVIFDDLEIDVYDLLEVNNGNHYITNSITSHNCAFVDNWDEFYTSVYPTISSGETTKILLTSTPLGYNHFWKFWNDAEQGVNGFVPLFIPLGLVL